MEPSDFIFSQSVPQGEGLSPQVKTSNSFDIIIIGAGISGLVAAKEIVESYSENDEASIQSTDFSPLSILILESRDRCGGRTESIHANCNGNINIDIGGQWIGPKHTYLLNLVELYGLELIDLVQFVMKYYYSFKQF